MQTMCRLMVWNSPTTNQREKNANGYFSTWNHWNINAVCFLSKEMENRFIYVRGNWQINDKTTKSCVVRNIGLLLRWASISTFIPNQTMQNKCDMNTESSNEPFLETHRNTITKRYFLRLLSRLLSRFLTKLGFFAISKSDFRCKLKFAMAILPCKRFAHLRESTFKRTNFHCE